MKLKLDLHPIYSDSHRIEEALQSVIEEAISKRASEVEIIPGKGSGALKKSVLRFLDRPEIKCHYHRIDKDSDNWGRLFVYFRHDREQAGARSKSVDTIVTVEAKCACCDGSIPVPEPDENQPPGIDVECPWCGSPNRLTLSPERGGRWRIGAELHYEDA